MKGKLTIEQVETEAQRKEFIRLPWKVYQDDPYWVPPLVSEQVALMSPEKHPFHQHADVVYFLARRDGDVVGTIAALVNHRHNEYWDEQMGFFGLFEVLKDREAAEVLLETACDWVRDQGMTAVRGPANYSTNEEIGLLVDGWNGIPVIMMTYNPRYYIDFIEGAGFVKAMDMYAYLFDLEPYAEGNLPDRVVRIVEKVKERRGLRVRSINLRNFDEEIARVKKIYNAAWSKNWGFVPLTNAELDYIAEQLVQIVDPDLTCFVERDDEPVGMFIALPNVNRPLRKAYPHPDTPELWTMLKLLWHWKVRGSVETARAFMGGILEEHRGVGADVMMAIELAQALLRKGYRYCEGSWILENNDATRRTVEAYGGEIYRTYRLYEKAL